MKFTVKKVNRKTKNLIATLLVPIAYAPAGISVIHFYASYNKVGILANVLLTVTIFLSCTALAYWIINDERKLWPFSHLISSRSILLSLTVLLPIFLIFFLFSFSVHKNPFYAALQGTIIFVNFFVVLTFLDKIEFDKLRLENITEKKLVILQNHYLGYFKTFFTAVIFAVMVSGATVLITLTGDAILINKTPSLYKFVTTFVLIWGVIGVQLFLILVLTWDILQKIKTVF